MASTNTGIIARAMAFVIVFSFSLVAIDATAAFAGKSDSATAAGDGHSIEFGGQEVGATRHGKKKLKSPTEKSPETVLRRQVGKHDQRFSKTPETKGQQNAEEFSGPTKLKVTYKTSCNQVLSTRDSCITFSEAPCPEGAPLTQRTVETLKGKVIAQDSYCSDQSEPAVTAENGDDAGDVQTAIQAAIKEQRKIEVTPDRFQSFPILSSKVFSQPNGFSLRNGHAHMYATPNPQTFNVEIFDEPVRVRAIPQSYLWNYGDGHSRKLQKPGKPMPNHTFDQPTDTSHVYEETGDFTIQLSTAYRGEYSVDGGPWMPIPGTASVPSDPMPMSVWRTKKLLVDQDCANNPGGPACDSPFLREKSAAK
ncbi:hypothetical protein ACTXOR_05200 [Arthrobacter rhombi]|uniref:hypothetical protein n=2 Tax=Arthrobacter rhombi TaxID=71253 RepID=UPI003FD13694